MSAIEFSVIAPILILLVFTVIQAGLWWYGRNAALAGAREGASYLRLAGTSTDPGAYEDQARSIAEDYAGSIGNLDDVSATAVIDTETGRATVVVTGSATLPTGETEITQEVSVTVEQFVGDTDGL